MAYDVAGARRRVHAQILKFGSSATSPGAVGVLQTLEGGTERNCIVGVADYKPHERGLVEEGARRALISALAPDLTPLNPPPNHQTERVKIAGYWYTFAAPILGPQPGSEAVFYDCQVIQGDPA